MSEHNRRVGGGRRLLASAVLGLGLLVAPAAASATDYGTGVSASFSDNTPAPGESIVVTCTGDPNDVVIVTVTSPDGKTTTLATGVVGADGTCSIPVTIPSDLGKGVSVLAVSVDGEIAATTSITVGSSGSGTTSTSASTTTTTGSRLPVTGSSASLLLPIAGGLLIAGGAAVGASRRRDQAPNEA